MAKIMGFLFLGLFLAVLSTCSPDVDESKVTGTPVSGYAVSNLVYAFDTENPSNLTTVTFDLNNPAASVKVGLTTGGSLQDCASATPFTHWTCALTGVTVTNAASLRVVATQ